MKYVKELQEKIIEHTGDKTSLEDIRKYGAESVGGFIYYSDLYEFYEKNKNLIWMILNFLTFEYGYKDILEMLYKTKNFDIDSEGSLISYMVWVAVEYACSVNVEDEE